MTCYEFICSHCIGGKFICKNKSFTRFAIQSECCNFNQQVMWLLSSLIITSTKWKPPHQLYKISGSIIFKRSCCPVFSHNRNWISKPWRISLSSRKRRASFNMWEKFHRKLIKTPLVYQAEPLPPIPHFFMAHNVFWTLW